MKDINKNPNQICWSVTQKCQIMGLSEQTTISSWQQCRAWCCSHSSECNAWQFDGPDNAGQCWAGLFGSTNCGSMWSYGEQSVQAPSFSERQMVMNDYNFGKQQVLSITTTSTTVNPGQCGLTLNKNGGSLAYVASSQFTKTASWPQVNKKALAAISECLQGGYQTCMQLKKGKADPEADLRRSYSIIA